MVSTSSLLACDKGQCSLVGETPVERIYDIRVPLRGSVFRQIKGIQRKLSPAFAGFQMPTAQNNRYTKAVYFGEACPELLQSYFGWHILLSFRSIPLALMPGQRAQHGGTLSSWSGTHTSKAEGTSAA